MAPSKACGLQSSRIGDATAGLAAHQAHAAKKASTLARLLLIAIVASPPRRQKMSDAFLYTLM
ncbi:hypothetical protein C9I28_25750 [Pseudoduganella armeniaca]|uniref:Uncharacterized protein n=1 Tax=Pseudoduganella armeniaca TaxID=2072590 RepID=A0A2R4CGS5_9BURK|nr:hypothetical protein C9I28_25750 [Pseudoduganella armeniaca]